MAIPANIERRIKALQAMAADTSSEKEAMAATKRLHILLSQYNLTAFDFEGGGEDEIGKDNMFVDHERLGTWSGLIARGVAELYFCKMYQCSTVGKGKSRARKFVVNGTERNRTTAICMIKSVIDAIHRESKLSSQKDRPFGEDGWSYICSFRKAAGNRVFYRCMDLIKQAKEGELVDEDTGRNLPVMVDAYKKNEMAVADFMADLEFGRSNQRSSAKSIHGANRGAEFGNRVGLHQGIAAEAKARLLA